MTLMAGTISETPVARRTESANQADLSPEEQRIGAMLTYRRPHDSMGEAEFIKRYILPFNPEAISEKGGDTHAYVVRIYDPKKTKLTTAFCAHTDSVHNRQNQEPRQPVGFDIAVREFYVSDPAQRDCLGADDAAGCYVLLRLMEANVPGLYVFFRGEERGGIGSSYITDHRQDLFAGIERAIQFDRRGTGSVITEMMCGRTCSDEFAEAIGKALDMGHEIDPTGSFTDTANLSEIVPECTNISVGYEHEHSSNETLNAAYLLALVDRCITVFSDSELDLPTKRMPADYRTGSSGFWKGQTQVGGYASEYGISVSAYDLPEMTTKELVELVDCMTYEELVELLREAGDAICEAYPAYYTSRRI